MVPRAEIKNNSSSQIAPFLTKSEEIIIRDKHEDIFENGAIEIKTSKKENSLDKLRTNYNYKDISNLHYALLPLILSVPVS